MFASLIIMKVWEGGLVNPGLADRKTNKRPFTVPRKAFPSSF